MPGNGISVPDKRKTHLFYLPLALEIFLGFIPFLILGGWFLTRLLGELTIYESGMNWMTMVRMLQMEADRFEEQMQDDAVKVLDLGERTQQIILPVREQEGVEDIHFGTWSPGLSETANDIRTYYIFYGDNGELTELDPDKREISVIPADTEYHEIAAEAIREKVYSENFMRTSYQIGGNEYYGSFIPLVTSKPVQCGAVTLSDGSEGSCILVSGQISFNKTENNVRVHLMRMNALTFSLFVLFVAVVCFGVFWSLRKLRKITRIMKSLSSGKRTFQDPEIMEFMEDKRLKEGVMPEIRDLMEYFQLLFLSIRKYQRSVSGIREAFEPVLPAAFLALFHRDDIREIRPGDQAIVKGRVLEVRMTPEGAPEERKLLKRNVLLGKILKILTSADMLVTELEFDRITAILLPEEEKTAESAVRAENTVGSAGTAKAEKTETEKTEAEKTEAEKTETEKAEAQKTEAPALTPEEAADQIRRLDGSDSGADKITAELLDGEFCYTVTGIPDHMAIRMEQI